MSQSPPRSHQRLFSLVVGLAIWSASHGVAWAQGSGSSGVSGSYVVPYAIVILCIAAGVYAVTRSSRRQDPAKAGPLDVGVLLPGQHAPKEATRRVGIQMTKEQSKDAKNALVLGIVSIVIPGLGLVLGPIAIIKGIQARKTILRNPRLIGEGTAIGAVGAGATGIVVSLVILVMLLMSMAG